jgi:hypothetical protein
LFNAHNMIFFNSNPERSYIFSKIYISSAQIFCPIENILT